MGVRQNEKTGHWEVDFRDQHRKRIQKTFKRKKDADDYYTENRRAVRLGTYVKPSKDTVAEKSDEWLEAKKATGGYRYGTLQNWEIHIRDYIKPAPSAGAGAPAVNVGDPVTGGTIPLPSPLTDKIPKLQGGRFTIRNGSIVIFKRDAQKADAVLPPL